MGNLEDQFKDKCEAHFSKHFTCQRERWSKCGKYRIDIILSTDNGEHFGVEAKIPDRKSGEKLGEWVKQAIGYSNCEFEIRDKVFKQIPIFICPPISYRYFILNDSEIIIEGEKWHKDRHKETNNHHSMNGFLGAFNVGEIRNMGGNDFALIFSNKIIYDTRLKSVYEGNVFKGKVKAGIHSENYTKLINKISK